MNMWKTAALVTAFASLHGTTALAGCGLTEGSISIVGNEFPAIQTVAKGAEACAGDGVKVTANLTADHQKINLAGMQGNPCQLVHCFLDQ